MIEEVDHKVLPRKRVEDALRKWDGGLSDQ